MSSSTSPLWRNPFQRRTTIFIFTIRRLPEADRNVCSAKFVTESNYPSDHVALKFCLSTQIGSRSSVYSPESKVRKTGSYIYEDFIPTDGADVKVSTTLKFVVCYMTVNSVCLGLHCWARLCSRRSPQISRARWEGGA